VRFGQAAAADEIGIVVHGTTAVDRGGAVLLHLRGDQGLHRLGQRQLSNTHLDGTLPQAGHAEERLIVLVLDRRPRSGSEVRAAHDEPEEGMRVEQDPHGA
jgi:hypothetical protein